jgi:hypothetical protein
VRHHRLLVGVALTVLCAWCGWVSGFHRTTLAAEITWVCSLAAVLAVDLAFWRGRRGLRPGWRLDPVGRPWPRPGRGGGRSALRGTAPWIVLFLVALTWDVLGIDTGPHQAHLTISALAQTYRPLDAALLLVWMLAGIGYEVALARAPVDARRVPASGAHAKPDHPEPGGAMGGVLAFTGHPVTPALLLPKDPAVGVAFWVALPVAAVLVEVAARRSDGRVANAEELVRFISTPLAARIVLVVAWVFAGYHLFAR